MAPHSLVNPTRAAVLRTLAFFDVMGCALSREELEFFLWQEAGQDSNGAGRSWLGSSDLELFLKQVIWSQERHLVYRDGLFGLRPEAGFWRSCELKRARQNEWLKFAARWRWIFQICPFVEFVGLCNSVALGDVDEDSDLDVLVVARSGRLFLARTWLTVLTQLFGVRRHGIHLKQRFCLSFYVTEKKLDFAPLLLKPKDPSYDPYFAFWLRSLLPFAGSYGVYTQLLQKNRPWMDVFFAPAVASRRWFRPRTAVEEALRWIFEALTGMEWLEKFLQKFQMDRALVKRQALLDPSGTVISLDMLKFHDHDSRLTFARRTELRLRDLR